MSWAWDTLCDFQISTDLKTVGDNTHEDSRFQPIFNIVILSEAA